MKHSMLVNAVICLAFFTLEIYSEENNSDDESATVNGMEISAYTGEEFQNEIEKNAHFVMFYAPWCGHCQRLKPVWEKLVMDIREDDELDIVLAKVDCTAQTKLCSDQGVLGYPTLKFYRPGQESIRHKGGRDLVSLKNFVKTSLLSKRKESSLPMHENGFYELTNDDFEDHIASSKHFVMFYAPWCGHCKRLEPVWLDLAKSYAPIDGIIKEVKIGRVDCTKQREVCGKYEVRGYPTLLWFENGVQKEKYQGDRQLKSLQDFVGKMTGTDIEAGEEQDKSPEKEESILYDLNAENFVALTSTGSHFIMFYAPWCGHCKRLEPTWLELAKLYQSSDAFPSNVNIGRVDCTANKDICSNHGVRGYPTLLWFKEGVKIKGYQGARDIGSLKNFVNVMLMPEEEPVEQQEVKETELSDPDYDDEDESVVIQMKPENFDFYIAVDVTFVMFYAPWCGFCKRLAPVWEELAVLDYSDLNRDVTVAKVDCTKHTSLCSNYEVKGYPTLILFKEGEQVATYSGNRSKEDLKKFIVEEITKAEATKPKEEL